MRPAIKKLPLSRCRAGCAAPGLTLIEMLAVTVLMAMVVSMTTLRLNGIGLNARLRTTGRQIAELYRVGRIQALTEGRPRILELSEPTQETPRRLRLLTPTIEKNEIVWQGGAGIPLDRELHVLNVAIDAAPRTDKKEPNSPQRIWLSPEGLNPNVVVVLGEETPVAALFIDGITGEDRMRWLSGSESHDPQKLFKMFEHPRRPDAD